ncbi:hypothetical protein EWM64_g5640 [Hericium alpestre]|uniref:FAD/NAD(P)-binding domain-containing protein n=1 Tax=Hericium alpestre TaxID=135208 RepID=A0A4Y9ZW13_9AGAM|nr:hypothetical protein EWM64_g5640 [Hericium alpestre]
MHGTHRTIMIEKNTHFNNLFAFPRYAVVPKYEHRAFIPYTTMFSHLPPDAVSVHRGRVTEIHPDCVLLEGEASIPYEYLVVATGTRLTPPGTLPTDTKPEGIAYFQAHQKVVKNAQKIVIVGGGANGVPARDRARAVAELHVNVVLNDRVRIPTGGFPVDGSDFAVELASGNRLAADLVIMATGQTPNSAPLRTLAPGAITPAGYISVLRTLQLTDPAYPRVFALGDVADTTHHKAARPAEHQAVVVAENIRRLADGKGKPLEKYKDQSRGIHLSLGIKRSVFFDSPMDPDGEPVFKIDEDGTPDFDADRFWRTKAPGITDYYL